MIALLSAVGAATVAGVFAVSGVLHLARPSLLRVALRLQALWPRALQPAVAWAVTTLELVISLCAFVALAGVVSSRSFSVATFGAAAALSATYCVYSVLVLSRRPGVPCGCEGGDTPISAVVPIRAGCMTAVAGLAATTDPAAYVAMLNGTERVIVAEAVLTFVGLALVMPSAVRKPIPSGGGQP